MDCARPGCPGDLPVNKPDMEHCSTLCQHLHYTEVRLIKWMEKLERKGEDSTRIAEQWFAVERVSEAVSEYRRVVREQAVAKIETERL